MFGYYGAPFVDVDRYVDSWSGEMFAAQAKEWHDMADKVAAYNPRLAARCRDIAWACHALTTLANDIKRQRAHK